MLEHIYTHWQTYLYVYLTISNVFVIGLTATKGSAPKMSNEKIVATIIWTSILWLPAVIYVGSILLMLLVECIDDKLKNRGNNRKPKG